MKVKRQKKQGFLETCASSDLAFLLIIYFMVIAGFNINQGFLMNLPAKDSSRLILRDDLLRFEMDEAGYVIHEGEIIDLTNTRNLIRSAQAANPNIAVIITIDKQAHWQI